MADRISTEDARRIGKKMREKQAFMSHDWWADCAADLVDARARITALERECAALRDTVAALVELPVVQQQQSGDYECMLCDRFARYNDRGGLEHTEECPLASPAAAAQSWRERTRAEAREDTRMRAESELLAFLAGAEGNHEYANNGLALIAALRRSLATTPKVG